MNAAAAIKTTLAKPHHMGYRNATVRHGADSYKLLIRADDTVAVTFATIAGVGHQDRRQTTTERTRPVLQAAIQDLSAKTGRSLRLADI